MKLRLFSSIKPKTIIYLGEACLLIVMAAAAGLAADRIVINGPAGSGGFGTQIYKLPNGNIVVTDPKFSPQPNAPSAGAVYLYDGTSLSLISRLSGTASSSFVGSGGITILPTGDFLVRSPDWNGYVGAVTFCSQTSGCAGNVSAANSLVGEFVNDHVGLADPFILANGNYLLAVTWNSGRGAIVWCNGTTGTVGTVSSAHSLLGSTPDESIGSAIYPLSNGNFVVISNYWNSNRGAATFCSGTEGCSGEISSSNSLVSTTPQDMVGFNGQLPGVIELKDGNYVVITPRWTNNGQSKAGAATWGNGQTGVSGEISASNSLVGTAVNDSVGMDVVALANGNYVSVNHLWSARRGSATFCIGSTGCRGPVTEANSLYGGVGNNDFASTFVYSLTNGNYVMYVASGHFGVYQGLVIFANGNTGLTGSLQNTSFFIGGFGDKNSVTPLVNGNYVIRSYHGVTLANGTTGISGEVSAANSMTFEGIIGSEDRVYALPNGNYVACIPDANIGQLGRAGAVILGNGQTGVTGVVSAQNSLVGSHNSDQIGKNGIAVLSNGNFVISSPVWNQYRGAATFANGTTGITGEVSSANSLIGSNPDADEQVGGLINPLTNGNYVLTSWAWGGHRGAVTVGSGITGISGEVSGANSLIGANQDDRIGNGNNLAGVIALSDGSFVISSNYDGRGLATWVDGTSGTHGFVSLDNSLYGGLTSDGVGSGDYFHHPARPGTAVFPNGNYLIFSPGVDIGSLVDAGAVTIGRAHRPLLGQVTTANSICNNVSNESDSFSYDYDPVNKQYVVGQSIMNRVTVVRNDDRKAIFDFDGDGKSDLSVFRPSTGAWYLNRSTAGIIGITWGVSTDVIAPADYDGDGKTDVAVFRPSEGRWYIFNSATSSFSTSLWGTSTDIPAPADYDGDGKADISIFRPSDGNWWLQRTSLGTLTTQFGQNGDVPAVGDYDGDGKSDIGIFRPSNGVWFIRRSTAGDIGYQFGFGTDKITQADYDGDGKTDIAIYRPSTGQWFIANSGSATYPVISFGAATDIPTPGDYDGDGKADVAIFRPSDGNWWLNRSTAGVTVTQFGQNGDKPTQNAYGN